MIEKYKKKLQEKLIKFPKQNLQDPNFKKRKIYKGNEMCFKTLKEKGLFKNFKNYKDFLKQKNLC